MKDSTLDRSGNGTEHRVRWIIHKAFVNVALWLRCVNTPDKRGWHSHPEQGPSEPMGNLFPPWGLWLLLALLAYTEACPLRFLHGCMWCHGAKVLPCMSKTVFIQEGFWSTKLYSSHRPLKPNHIPGKEWRDLVFNIFGIRWKPLAEKHPSLLPSDCHSLTEELVILLSGSQSL